MDEISYEYRPKPGSMVGGLILTPALAVGLGYHAMTNDRGLVLSGIIHLGPVGASLFYAFLAVVTGMGLVLMLQMLRAALFLKRSVTLSRAMVSAPPSGASSSLVTLNLIDIVETSVQVIHKQRRLCITHTKGKLLIHESCLPETSDFEYLCTALGERVAAVRK